MVNLPPRKAIVKHIENSIALQKDFPTKCQNKALSHEFNIILDMLLSLYFEKLKKSNHGVSSGTPNKKVNTKEKTSRLTKTRTF